jgi:hypothetical protein
LAKLLLYVVTWLYVTYVRCIHLDVCGGLHNPALSIAHPLLIYSPDNFVNVINYGSVHIELLVVPVAIAVNVLVKVTL